MSSDHICFGFYNFYPDGIIERTIHHISALDMEWSLTLLDPFYPYFVVDHKRHSVHFSLMPWWPLKVRRRELCDDFILLLIWFFAFSFVVSSYLVVWIICFCGEVWNVGLFGGLYRAKTCALRTGKKSPSFIRAYFLC